jgi:dUTP pyrophosphatase
MIVKIKKLNENAVIPKYSKEGDAGMDLVATSRGFDADGITTYGIGLAFEIPEGHVGLIFPRSSVYKYNQIQSNCIGVLDSGYRNEVFIKLRDTNIKYNNRYNIGDRIAQLIILPYPNIEFEEVEELSETERGTGGFGSTGK